MLAVWSITCLLMAASLNPTVRALFSVVARKYTSKDLTWLLKILCTVAHNFYHQNVRGAYNLLCIYNFIFGRISHKNKRKHL